MAKKHNVTATQVILGWHVARDTVVLPRSTNPERQKENLTVSCTHDSTDLLPDSLLQLPVLDEDDIKKINALDRNQRIVNLPDANGKVFGWPMERYGW